MLTYLSTFFIWRNISCLWWLAAAINSKRSQEQWDNANNQHFHFTVKHFSVHFSWNVIALHFFLGVSRFFLLSILTFFPLTTAVLHNLSTNILVLYPKSSKALLTICTKTSLAGETIYWLKKKKKKNVLNDPTQKLKAAVGSELYSIINTLLRAF